MIEERLLVYCDNMKNKLPENILFYRDGVSESQYGMVHDKEVQLIRDGCRAAGKKKGKGDNWLPKITVIIVGKRHHTRFYPNPAKPRESRKPNLEAGLVVDNHIVHPKQFSFYLQSHSSPQGTARSGHYVVIYDTYNYSPAVIQDIVSNI